MNETPFFFDRGGSRLFGVLHRPGTEPTRVGFLLCSPFVEEKLWVHRVFVHFARRLSGLGHTVLRFDYMGHGDSDGDFEEATVETRLADIAAASERLGNDDPGVDRIVLLGIRFGATLAALAADRDPRYGHLVLWEPVPKGDDYILDVFRSNLTTQMAVYREIRENRQALVRSLEEGKTVNVDGYEITKTLFDQISSIDLLSGERAFRGPTLVVQVAGGQAPANRRFEQIAARYADATLARAEDPPFWREIKPYVPKAVNLERVTIEWLGAKGI